MTRKIKQYKPVKFGDRPDPVPLKAIETGWLRLRKPGPTTGGEGCSCELTWLGAVASVLHGGELVCAGPGDGEQEGGFTY
jgi:hypothetical protein